MTGSELLQQAVDLQRKPRRSHWKVKVYEKHWPAVRDAWQLLEKEPLPKSTTKKHVIRALIAGFPDDFPSRVINRETGETESDNKKLLRVYRAFLNHESKNQS